MDHIIASTYQIIEKIGSGGGGNVYLAIHLRLNKKVILKADKRKVTTKLELLRREVDTLKNLSHAYIPQVYDYFVEDEIVYTVMDYIEGESLDKPLKRGERFEQPQVIKWAKQLLEALAYLHNPIHGDPPRGYVHSDIKPANMMRTPQNNLCLIDFNIALALGEENIVGCSPGYASPEHYGLDYSSFTGETLTKDDETVTLLDETKTLTQPADHSESMVKKIVPDVRSDIYSVGATLYHLLCGRKPEKNAMDVIPLSKDEFSPLLVEIIAKAMTPNPDLRYQTAEEMLQDLNNLHINDPRVIKLRKQRKWFTVVLSLLLVLGTFTSFVGLKRIQVIESWLKLAEYSQNALDNGDSVAAIEFALQALPDKQGIFTPGPIAEAQDVLTSALGVYDLADGFKKYKVVELPSNPLYMTISPSGETAACVYSGSIAVFDTESADILFTLSADKSAHSEVEYIDNDTIVYSGTKGMTVFDISTGSEKWVGNKSTGICVSDDRKTIAGIYKDETFATIYDAENGTVKTTVDFKGKFQSVTVNDTFANPNDNLFAIDANGTMLAVSFDDGSLEIYDLTNSGNDIELFDNTSGYTHFEGGFYEQYLAFSASKKNESIFAVIDTVAKEQTGGFESESYFGVSADSSGVYVQTQNLLVKIHPVSGEQTPLVTTPESLYRFDTSGEHTIATTKEQIMFFNSDSKLISSFKEEETGDYVQISNGIVLVGSLDTPIIKILKYEDHKSAEVFNYDSSYEHDEARISADGKNIMLFSYKQFRVYTIDGTLVNEVDIPDPEQVYDQQYRRENGESYLEVIYNDGLRRKYNARDGSLVEEQNGDKPDLSLYEEFETNSWRVESPLHGSPKVYNKESDKLICELSEDGYLTYVTQIDGYVVMQFVTMDDYYYGLLMNDKCEVVAHLPHLTDVYDNELYFDYSTGNIRKSRIYNIDELKKMAQAELTGGK